MHRISTWLSSHHLRRERRIEHGKWIQLCYLWCFPGGSVVKNLLANAGDVGLIPVSGRSSGEGNGTLVFLPEKSHGQRSLAGYSPWGQQRVGHDLANKCSHLEKSHGWRSLVGCSPWGHYELDTTERLHFHFSLSCIGEGHGNPLQCSCLENPRDGGAWWAAVSGVALSRTRLKRLSSRSSSN